MERSNHGAALLAPWVTPVPVVLPERPDEPRVVRGFDALLVVVLSLLAFFLLPVFLTGARLPFGSDATYYVWMTRLAGHAGLAEAGFRAGSHALLLDASKWSGLDLLQAIGPLDVALEVALGLAAAALVTVTLGYSRARFVVVGVVTSAYAARMATGYLANLLFMVLFLAALTLLLADRRRATLALGTAMLAAAGLAHGPFYAYGVVLLGGALVLRLLWSARAPERRVDERRLFAAIAGSALFLGLLVLTGRISVTGSPVLHSGDAILRTLHLRDLLHAQYSQRLPGAVTAAGLAATVPLAVWGAWFGMRSAARRSRLAVTVLLSWVVVTAGGIGAGLATGLFPAGRVLGVAIWLPILASLGVLGIATFLTRNRSLRFAFAALLTFGLLVAPFRSLMGSNVAASPAEIQAVSAAGHFASTLPPHTPLVYLADVEGSNPAFQASRFENITRMGLPADRMDDVFLYLGSPADLAARKPALDGDPVHDSLARLYAQRARAVLARPHAVFLLQPLDREGWRVFVGGRTIAPGTRVLIAPVRRGTADGPVLRKLSPGGRLGFAIVFLLVLFGIGLGCVRAALPGLRGAARGALAPAVGAGVITLSTVLVMAVQH